MDAVYLAEALQESVKHRFKGKQSIKSRTVLRFPDTLAREYKRIVNAYMALFNKALQKNLPEIRKAIDAERSEMRQDSIYDVLGISKRTFEKILADFEKSVNQYNLYKQMDKLANLTKKLTIREWKRVVHHSLGINLIDDYYLGRFYRDNLSLWVKNNVGMIKTIPQDTLSRMETIIEEGYLAGKSNTAIGRDITQAYQQQKHRAQLLARDQVAKLNADITQKQQQDAGVDSYVWSSSKDVRVRDCHLDFDGKEFKWSEPPENYYNTKSRGRVYIGRYHPGQAPGCRCCSLPVFNLENLSLPWESDISGKDT